MNSDSPIGDSATAASARRAESPGYLAEQRRVAPYEAVARVVIARRGALGLSQQDLARRVGTTASVISRIESGRHSTTANTLRRVFEALDGRLLIGIEYESKGKARQTIVSV